jgi:hypothetical protein
LPVGTYERVGSEIVCYLLKVHLKGAGLL